MSTCKTQTIQVVESRQVVGVYDMICTEAIIEHPKHGRLYISEGWGGDEVHGEMYRWQHGVVCRLRPGDTLEVLDDALGIATVRELIHSGCDSTRPCLEWSGAAIAQFAKRLRL